MRIHRVNRCRNKIEKTLFKRSIEIDLVSKIFDGKTIYIPQEVHDYITKYFLELQKASASIEVNQSFILISDFMRFAKNSPSFINNIEKATKYKVLDKTTSETVDMVVLSILNNLFQNQNSKNLLDDDITILNLNKRKILLKKVDEDFELNSGFHLQKFSTLTLEKFIKKDFFKWSKLSINKSVNPIGKKKAGKILNTYLKYLSEKIPKEYINKLAERNNDSTQITKKMAAYVNKKIPKKKEVKKTSLVLTGETVLKSISALKIRGNWIRRDHLKNKILEFAGMQDNRIPSEVPKYTVINLMIIYGHMKILSFDRAYIQESSFEEGFLLHPSYH